MKIFEKTPLGWVSAFACLAIGSPLCVSGCSPEGTGTIKVKASDYEKKKMGSAADGAPVGSSKSPKAKFQVKSIKNRPQE